MSGGTSQELVWKLQNGDLDEVKKCFKDKSVVNQKLDSGRYPIHHAADYGQSDILAYLISCGADVNLNDKYGISPLLSAVYEGHTESVRILVDKGANKNGRAPDGSEFKDCTDKQEIKDLLK